MGTYLNPGKAAYEEAVNSEIFIDKTEMLIYLNSVVKTKQKYVSVSRPRRFGKTMAADMISAYYDREADSRELFSQRKLAQIPGEFQVQNNTKESYWDEYLGQFDVIRLVMTDFMEDSASVQDMLGTETGKSPKATRYALYSPLSVVEAMTTGVIKDYWNQTETYEALAEYIRKDFDGLKDSVALLMDGGRLKIDTSTYQNDMTTFHGRDDILSLLIHLGYLGYDDETGQVFIPNREILDEFRTSTKGSEWLDTFKAYETSEALLKATWNQEADKVAELLENAHNKAGNKNTEPGFKHHQCKIERA